MSTYVHACMCVCVFCNFYICFKHAFLSFPTHFKNPAWNSLGFLTPVNSVSSILGNSQPLLLLELFLSILSPVLELLLIAMSHSFPYLLICILYFLSFGLSVLCSVAFFSNPSASSQIISLAKSNFYCILKFQL
uniref:Uncharacterized protein n=1 Tax=Rousettus aegyptiacus TaxID=9407 RepID=A0A7J8CHX6_ROUAE|nr:hypothetical protein HJG63_008994 [Rousettus aegyptiacus]